MFRRSLSALILMGMLLAACAPAATQAPAPTATATPAPIALVDALGREVTLAAPAQRIVSLAPSNTEIIFALGAGGQLVGREEFSDYPPEALNVPSVGSLYPRVNAEAIVALQPDLVLAAGITNPDDVQALADLKLTVYATSFAGSLDEIYGDILAVGQLAGRDAEAQALAAGMRARVEAVQARVAGAERPRVFYEIDATDPAKPWTAGAGSLIDQLLTAAGGQNVGAQMTDAYAQMSLEALVAADPQVIVLGSATYGGQTPETVANRAGWGSISALKNGAVHPFDDNLVSRPGPRIADGLEALARLLHPDLFK